MKHKFITCAAAAASIIALGAGCASSHREMASNECVPVINHGRAAEVYQTTPAMGATGNVYETESGQASQQTQWNSRQWNESQDQTQGSAGQWQSGRGDVVIPLEREQMSVNKQPVHEGAVRVRKYVKTETVSQPVQIRQEVVTVERVEGNARRDNATALNQPFRGGEITIPLMKEQPVIQTQIVPNGAVVIHRQDTTKSVNVQGQVRTERIAAEPVGNPQNVNISGDLRGDADRGQFQGAAPSSYGQTAGAGGGGTITQMNDLCAASDQSSLANRQVNLANARIQKVISDRLITVAGDNGKTFYVRLDQPASGLREGQMIALNGTVRAVPSDPSSMGWDHKSARAIQGQQIVIEVPSLQAQ